MTNNRIRISCSSRVSEQTFIFSLLVFVFCKFVFFPNSKSFGEEPIARLRPTDEPSNPLRQTTTRHHETRRQARRKRERNGEKRCCDKFRIIGELSSAERERERSLAFFALVASRPPFPHRRVETPVVEFPAAPFALPFSLVLPLRGATSVANLPPSFSAILP